MATPIKDISEVKFMIASLIESLTELKKTKEDNAPYYTSSEFLNELQNIDSITNFAYHFFDVLYQASFDIPNFKVELKDGGGEGGGELVTFVFSHLNYYYIQMSFSYFSHHGYEFDDANIYWVKPQQVTVTKYL